MQDEDRIRIGHMIEAAEDVLGFAAGRTRADLDTDRMLLFALVRAVEIIGEAASKVSDEMRSAHAGIPWKPSLVCVIAWCMPTSTLTRIFSGLL